MTTKTSDLDTFRMRKGVNTIWEVSIAQRTIGWAWIILLVFANLVILLPAPLPLTALGSCLLLGLLPGFALMSAVFPSTSELEPVDRGIFSIGASVTLSAQAIWLYSMLAATMVPLGLL